MTFKALFMTSIIKPTRLAFAVSFSASNKCSLFKGITFCALFRIASNDKTKCTLCDNSKERVLVGGNPGECKCETGWYDDGINELCQ